MNAKYRHVGRDQGLSDERREYRRVVTDVTFAIGNWTTTQNGGDTLDDVVLTTG